MQECLFIFTLLKRSRSNVAAEIVKNMMCLIRDIFQRSNSFLKQRRALLCSKGNVKDSLTEQKINRVNNSKPGIINPFEIMNFKFHDSEFLELGNQVGDKCRFNW